MFLHILFYFYNDSWPWNWIDIELIFLNCEFLSPELRAMNVFSFPFLSRPVSVPRAPIAHLTVKDF